MRQSSDETQALIETAALGAANVDAELMIPILAGDTVSGTYAKVATPGNNTVTRTVGAGADSYQMPIPIPSRTSALKGRMLTAIEANYSVNTAVLDDVLFVVHQVTMGADGAAPTTVAIGGLSNDDYDGSHNTPAERGDNTGAPELHRIVMTLPAPVYLPIDAQLLLEVRVDGDAGGAGVFVLNAAKAVFTETLVDLK